jgi:prepilin peptidase CpaA
MLSYGGLLQAGGVLVTAVTLAVLARIAWVDFKTQKITNRSVLLLSGLGLAALLLDALRRLDQLQPDVWSNLAISIAAAVALFVLLFPFWLLRKLGAGDVKLMAAALLVTGADGMLAFALLLLLFAAITAVLVKNPMLLPGPLFRQYLEHFERKGVVPFGVPIAAALIGVELLRFFLAPRLTF